MSKLKLKPRKKLRTFNATIADVVSMVDAMFEGNHDDGEHGWVMMVASRKGRECINALFPRAHIAWRNAEGLSDGWLGFDINLPDVIAATGTTLPLEITRGADLDEANPDALAYLLAHGVNCEGGRSAVWREGQMYIYVPPTGDN